MTYLGVWGRFCSARCTNRAWKERRRDEYLEGKRLYRARVKAQAAIDDPPLPVELALPELEKPLGVI